MARRTAPRSPTPEVSRCPAGLGERPERASSVQPACHRVGAVRHDVPPVLVVGDVGEQQLRPADHPPAGVRVEPGSLGVIGQGPVQPVVAGELGLRRQSGHQRGRHVQHRCLDGERVPPGPQVEAGLRPRRAVDQCRHVCSPVAHTTARRADRRGSRPRFDAPLFHPRTIGMPRPLPGGDGGEGGPGTPPAIAVAMRS